MSVTTGILRSVELQDQAVSSLWMVLYLLYAAGRYHAILCLPRWWRQRVLRAAICHFGSRSWYELVVLTKDSSSTRAKKSLTHRYGFVPWAIVSSLIRKSVLNI